MAGWTSGLSGPDIKQSGFWWRSGAIALWLRDRWLLAGLVFFGAVAIGVIPRTALDHQGRVFGWANDLTIGLATAAAVAVLLDKLADRHSAKLDAIEAVGQEQAGARAINRIISLLDEVHEMTYLPRNNAAIWAKGFHTVGPSTMASAPVVGDTVVRATYYPLETDGDGYRSMTNPKSRGRGDESSTTFVERNDPNHSIWTVLAQRDTECRIRSFPEQVEGLDWAQRPYKTFVTVPVKAANKVTFGMLTANALNKGDLTELDRVTAIAIARIIAVAQAIPKGYQEMGTLADAEARTLAAAEARRRPAALP